MLSIPALEEEAGFEKIELLEVAESGRLVFEVSGSPNFIAKAWRILKLDESMPKAIIDQDVFWFPYSGKLELLDSVHGPVRVTTYRLRPGPRFVVSD